MKKKTGKVLKKSFLPIILMVGIAAVSACRSEENRALEAALNPYRILSLPDEKRSVFLSETEEKITAAAESSPVPSESNTEAFWRIAAGYGYVAAGEFETALKSFESAFDKLHGLTSYPQFYYYAGVAAASQAKQSPIESQKALLFEKAIYYYNRALELSSTYTNAYYGLGVIYYFELGDADTGLEYALKAIGADPDQFGARYMAARIYVEKGDNAKAIEQYNYIIRHADKETAASAVRNKEILESDG